MPEVSEKLIRETQEHGGTKKELEELKRRIKMMNRKATSLDEIIEAQRTDKGKKGLRSNGGTNNLKTVFVNYDKTKT